MIQRIQSIYLLVATALVLIFYMFPIAVFVTPAFPYEFYSCHLTHPENLNPPITLFPLALLPIFSGILSVISIFMFKKRKLQMRLGKINMLILFTTIVFMFMYIYKIDSLLSGTVTYGFSGIFPVIAFGMVLMANRAIKSDDDLVRSADRIR